MYAGLRCGVLVRVAVLPSWYPPDGGWFFRDQAAWLQDLGLAVDVLYVRPRWIRQVAADLTSLNGFLRPLTYMESGLRVWRLEVFLPSGFHRIDPFLVSRASLRLVRRYIAEVGPPDIVHAHSTVWAGYAASRVRRAVGLPYVVTEHRGMLSLLPPAVREHVPEWWRPYLREALDNADAIVAVGSRLAEAMARYSSWGRPVTTIPNGVDTRVFEPADPGRSRQSTKGRGAADGEDRARERFTYVFVGNLTRQKGVHILLEAFDALRKQHPEVRLVFVGSGPERTYLGEEVAHRRLADAVEFRGQLDAAGVRTVLQSGDAFVLPSEWEGFGVALVEAVAVGLPIITTTGSPPEVCPEEVGLRVPYGDAKRLREAMEFMLRNRERYDPQTLHAFAVEHFDSRKVAAQIVALYEHVLAQRR